MAPKADNKMAAPEPGSDTNVHRSNEWTLESADRSQATGVASTVPTWTLPKDRSHRSR